MTKNLWFLTEERPKKNVLRTIFETFAKDYNYEYEVNEIKIIPLMNDSKFTFTYQVIGLNCNEVKNIYIKTVSGNSSFTDYLIFFQEKEPINTDTPIYAIEETKTDDKESRNTGVYQRCSKFVFIDNYYPETKKIMLYNLQIEQKLVPTETYIFGTKLLLNLGVEILGKKLCPELFKPFKSIEELIDFKDKMRKPPKGNVPILLKKYEDRIEISGRLVKSGRLSHDPNIGALTIISDVLRNLGWEKDIVITQHGLIQTQVGSKNKFVLIANKVGIKLDGLTIPKAQFNENYWKYDNSGEKIVTIFTHILVDEYTNAIAIFENHAGSEKGYFFEKDGTTRVLAKYKDREKYKDGDKTQIIEIPDLILYDEESETILNLEGEMFKNKENGIKQIQTFGFIEKDYIKKGYKKVSIERSVVLFGSKENTIQDKEVSLILNEEGKIILAEHSPLLFKNALKNLLS